MVWWRGLVCVVMCDGVWLLMQVSTRWLPLVVRLAWLLLQMVFVAVHAVMRNASTVWRGVLLCRV